VAIYAEQVEQHGRIRWLPRRGSGKSARAMSAERAARAACPVEPVAESVRVLGDDE
jgi:hypothetical protein